MTDKTTEAADSVRPLELFFDLVFVFTITQVASVLTAQPTLPGLAQTFVLLTFIWWMYGGYAWLTNALDLDKVGPRLLLLAGAAGFFLMSLTVPKAAGPGPWALLLGVAYLVVVLVHLIGFIGTSGHRGIKRVGPLNIASALIVLTAGLLTPDARLWVWGLAGLLEVLTPFIARIGGFSVRTGHFVERHGLAVIIVLGESIVGVGAAASHQNNVATTIVGALLALVVSAAMWWLYFGREERASQAQLELVPADRRPRVAAYSFGYAYFFIIFGISVAAVGLEKAIEAFLHPADGFPDLLLPAGVGLFLLGLAWFRRILSGSWPFARIMAALAVAVLVTPAALWLGGATALAAASLVLLGLILWEARQGPERRAHDDEVKHASPSASAPLPR